VRPNPPFDVTAGSPMPLNWPSLRGLPCGARRMTLTTNSPDNPILEIFLMGNGVNIDLARRGGEPGNAFDFGDVMFKQPVSRRVDAHQLWSCGVEFEVGRGERRGLLAGGSGCSG